MMKKQTLLLALGLTALICLGGFRPTALAPSQPQKAQMKLEQNKILVRRFVEECFNKGNLNVIDEIFADTLVINGHPTNREGLKQAATWWRTRFPDLHVTAEPLIAEGNKIGFWYTAHGTQKAEFLGIPPTDKQVTWFGFDLLRVVDGKIVEGWFVADRLGIAQQLGATLAPAQPQK